YPEANITINMVRNIKEKHGFVGEPRKKVQVDLPVRGVQTSFDVTTELKRACESIMPAVVETTMDMIAKFDPEFQERARKNIVLAGGCSQISGIENYLINATKEFAPCKFSRVEDPLYAGADGALGLSEDMPAKYWENI
ncbi:MAG: rod shape-determining protein, partial [Gammaproteobacteria bacterium]|nr:rod shape-determining protein [Gammaproteobacteria bacterium]